MALATACGAMLGGDAPPFLVEKGHASAGTQKFGRTQATKADQSSRMENRNASVSKVEFITNFVVKQALKSEVNMEEADKTELVTRRQIYMEGGPSSIRDEAPTWTNVNNQTREIGPQNSQVLPDPTEVARIQPACSTRGGSSRP